MRYWAVLPAAGSGRRFGSAQPKQYAPLCGRTVIEWSLAPFVADPRCAGVVVAVADADPCWPAVAQRLPAVHSTPGGEHRSQSVRAALEALSARAAAQDWVLVHDAARPCLGTAERDQLLATLEDDAVGGLLALAAADTLKREARGDDPHGGAVGAPPAAPRVAATAERGGLWRALTPQMFRYAALCSALDRAHAQARYPTDEAQAMEWQGEHPRLVAGSATNLKVTTADDLLLAAAILKERGSRHAERE